MIFFTCRFCLLRPATVLDGSYDGISRDALRVDRVLKGGPQGVGGGVPFTRDMFRNASSAQAALYPGFGTRVDLHSVDSGCACIRVGWFVCLVDDGVPVLLPDGSRMEL